jgi:acyl-CoA synthetase (AMP-forming)/AMP-acid ligase II
VKSIEQLPSAERIARDGPTWRNTTIAKEAWKKAERSPSAIAFFMEQEADVSYGEIALAARRLITALQGLGLRHGDVVSFQLPNWPETVAIDIACAALGLVVNPIVPIYRGRELRFILHDARTRVIFIPERFRSIDYVGMLLGLQKELPDLSHIVTVRAWDAIPGTLRYEDIAQSAPVDLASLPDIDPNSVKCRLYTSGTTGFPKAVLHSHNTLRRINDNSIEHAGIDANDVMVMPSPVTHITGYGSGINLPFASDARTAFMERWDAEAAIDFINRVGGSMTVGATPFLQELLDAAERRGDPLLTMRQFSCGGAAVPPQLVRRAYHVMPNCVTARVYGSTEAPIITLGWRDDMELAATTDGHVWNYEVRILDNEGREVPAGSDGEIAARGPGMFLGYADPQQNREAHTADGFFLTGDIGHLTPEGAIRITDRKKDIIIRGGENLSAKEIEDVLHGHPEVREAAVVSMPHPRLGEGVCAFVIPRGENSELSLEAIAHHCDLSGMARQKIPERLILVEDLPRTPSGKIRKDQLRRRLREENT